MKKPTASELREYANSIRFDLDAQAFIDHYEANGWRVGRVPMKDWRAAVRNWKRRAPEFRPRQRMPIQERNKRINELNERKAYWTRAPESAKRDRMLEQIRVELQTL